MDERNNDFDFDFMPIGQAIKNAREAKKITRDQLAEMLGIEPRHNDPVNLAVARVLYHAVDLFCLKNA